MKAKHTEKKRALQMRKCGKTYSEILAEVPVAKSTLSLWFRDCALSTTQKQKISQKRLAAARRGGKVRKENRIHKTKIIKDRACAEVPTLTRRELWLIGAALYWAEGAKEKEYSAGSARVDFSNSDPKMIKLFVFWLIDICGISRSNIVFGIYVHKTHEHRLDEIRDFWAQTTGFSKKHFDYVYLKRHNPKTIRKNVGNAYRGNLRVQVRASLDFNRRISGWIDGVCKNSRVV